jgi:hypothetical protein
MKARELGLLAALLGTAASLAVTSLRWTSATYDEGAHLPAGYTYWALGDHRLNPEQPPLVKLLAAAPLLLLSPVMHTEDVSWATARQWEFGRRFLYRGNDPHRLLFWGRLPMIGLLLALIVAVFVEGRRRFGAAGGAIAAGLAAFSAEVLGHGRLVTTDVALALFVFVAVAAFDRWLETRRPRPLAVAALAAAAAFAAKFSAPLLVPMLLALAAVEVARAAGPERRRVAVTSLGAVALVVGVSWAGLWAAYGFRHDLSPDPAVRARESAPLESAAGPVGRMAALAARSHLVPEDYLRGLVFVAENSAARRSFLLGRLSDHGFRAYFLVSFLLKTPLPLLVLTAGALVLAARRPSRTAVFLWLPVLVYVLASLSRGLQIGHRHLLPVLPFLFLAAAQAGLALGKGRAGRVALAVVLAWYAAGTLRVHPHYLAYFNEAAGGPSNGWRLLADSSLDWGQDLPGLAAWMRGQGLARIKLSYFGSAEPAAYGVAADLLPGTTSPPSPHVRRDVQPGDVVAVSVTNLQGVYLDGADAAMLARFRELRPVAEIGGSIRVYRSDFRWP